MGLFESVFAPATDYYFVATIKQFLRKHQADAGRSAGDENSIVGKLHGLFLSVRLPARLLVRILILSTQITPSIDVDGLAGDITIACEDDRYLGNLTGGSETSHRDKIRPQLGQ
jgi:hypothetical protein